MEKKQKRLLNAILIYLFLSASTFANVSTSHTNQTEQDKARQSALKPEQQEYQSSRSGVYKHKLVFPSETTCQYINKVDIISEDEKLTQRLLGGIALQAEHKCLGIAGIRILTATL